MGTVDRTEVVEVEVERDTADGWLRFVHGMGPQTVAFGRTGAYLAAQVADELNDPCPPVVCPAVRPRRLWGQRAETYHRVGDVGAGRDRTDAVVELTAGSDRASLRTHRAGQRVPHGRAVILPPAVGWV